MSSFQIVTLGCKVNQYESQVMRERLLAQGWEEDASPRLIIINTCAVTARSSAKARKILRRALVDNPEAGIYLTGCGVAQQSPDAQSLKQLIPESRRVCEFPSGPEKISWFKGHHRAFLKVQDGCDSFCSYCIIPYLRGPGRSRPRSELLAEANRLQEAGYREIVLTGIHLGRYGADQPSEGGLEDLLEDLLSFTKNFRIRLSSIEPREISSRLLELMTSSRICPHLHIPLQSGSNRILKLMNRNYTGACFLAGLDRARDIVSRLAISTDIMVGFPGEDETDFSQTMEVVAQAGFSRAHIFPFSPRRGTRAADWDRPPSEKVTERIGLLKALVDDCVRSFRVQSIGSSSYPLWEKIIPGRGAEGTDERYLKIIFPSKQVQLGSIEKVRIESVTGDYCLASRVPVCLDADKGSEMGNPVSEIARNSKEKLGSS